MFQNTDPAIAIRLFLSFLLATLTVALSGCSGMRMGEDSEYSRALTGGYRGDETLAILLPQSGRFAGAARVVREGIVAAQEADPQGKRPKLRFYDSADGSVTALVRQAAADGARLVIGPLQKPEVEKLAALPTLPIPVLALNEAPAVAMPPRNLYQFALSPEDEATEVARKAWGQGYRKVLLLYPEGNWGSRLSRAFLQEWKSLGGSMAATQVYDPAATDFSGSLARLGERATGADFLFMVATTKEAGRLWPQIRHQLGAELPVYATSHIYGGRFDPKGDQVLVGLSFVEIPWLIEPGQGDAVSAKGLHKELPQLYAMGVDAYRLGSRLEWMSANPQARVQGKTGLLAMDSRRRLQRELTLARIEPTGPVKEAGIDTGKPLTFVWTGPWKGIGSLLASKESPHHGADLP